MRDYGVDGQLGLEKTPEEYVAKMVDIFREARRVLRDDGTLFLNLGDTYARNGGGVECKLKTAHKMGVGQKNTYLAGAMQSINKVPVGLKEKDLVGIPWMVAFALRADGWYLRQDIIWCLSGGTWLYARTQKGDMPIMVRDLARLDTSTVQLWNGKKWTQLLGINRTHRNGQEIEIVLRSGERISCTPTHKFPTNRGLLSASEIRRGDILSSCQIPEPKTVKDCAIDEDAAWFAGLYVAEGSKSFDTIQITGHAKEAERLERVQRIAAKFGGSATHTITGNTMHIRVYGKVLNAIINELVSGRTAKDKCFAPVVWRYSNRFLDAMLDGYLSGDGHWDKANQRWRLGFTRNYNLERDLRTACARLGYCLTLKFSTVEYRGRLRPTFRGELRKSRNGHFNQRDRNQVVEIRKARCREVYDLGVADEPHLFSLASGILTHNSKPNPMPESVKDRCTKAHEYIFLLSKSERYYYDQDAIKEPASPDTHARYARGRSDNHKWADGGPGNQTIAKSFEHMRKPGVNPKAAVNSPGSKQNSSFSAAVKDIVEKRNKRSVWTVPTFPFPQAHFATFPPALIEPCILAGCPEGGIVGDMFAGSCTTGEVALKNFRRFIGIELNQIYANEIAMPRLKAEALRYKQIELLKN